MSSDNCGTKGTNGTDGRVSNGQLNDLLSNVSSFDLIPRQFFISWNGVPTIAYTGFPTTIETLKSSINEQMTSLRAENSGSRWPKTTIGCLNDGITLTLKQLTQLYQICCDISQHMNDQFNKHRTTIAMSSMSVVLMRCRSLEGIVYRSDIPLQLVPSKQLCSTTTTIASTPIMDRKDGLDQKDTSSVSCSPSTTSTTPTISSQQLSSVEKIMNEFTAETLETYLPLVNKDGGRYTHYKSSFVESTLVSFLNLPSSSSSVLTSTLSSLPTTITSSVGQHLLLDALTLFQRRVDETLPGCYHWFTPSSLHVTIRALS